MTSRSTPRGSVRIRPDIPKVAESSCVLGAFVNDTMFSDNYNYMNPEILVNLNGRNDTTSQRFHVGNQFWDSMCCFNSCPDFRTFVPSLFPSQASLRSIRPKLPLVPALDW